MKNSYLTLLLALLALLSVGAELTAQGGTAAGSEASTTDTTIPAGNVQSSSYPLPSDFVPLGGSPMKENDFARDEVIVWFPTALYEDAQKKYTEKVLEMNNGSEVLSFTSGGHYALVRIPKIPGNVCDWLGEGNPELPSSDGDANEVGLNYYLSTQAWFTDGTTTCGPADSDPDMSNYDPAAGCASSSNVIPPTGSSSVRVAIIDSGVDDNGSGTLNGCNFSAAKINSQGEFVAVNEAAHPHGSYVSNIITGMAQEQQIESQVSIHSYEVLNSDLRTTTFAVVAAIEDAALKPEATRPHIISMSIGFLPAICDYYTLDVYKSEESAVTDGDILNNAIRQAKAAGIIVIASAGNRGDNLSLRPQYPAAYTGRDKVLTIGALSCSQDTREGFSNFSVEHVDLFTTGSGVRAAHENCFREVNGTSFSTPIVAAKAAMHVTEQIQYDPEEVICLLKRQSRDFSGINPEIVSTYGIVDAGFSRNIVECAKDPKSYDGKTLTTSGFSITIAPNPFIGPVTVNIPQTKGKSESIVTIYDGQGLVVIRRASRKATEKFDLNILKPGVYWLNVQSESGSSTIPIVKN
jgi:hypothetical protein